MKLVNKKEETQETGTCEATQEDTQEKKGHMRNKHKEQTKETNTEKQRK